MKIGRNDPCHCGSKKKFKDCCAQGSQNKRIQKIAFISIGALVVIWFLSDIFTVSKNINNPLPTNRVWSEEHGHWHDVDTQPTKTPMQRPSGVAPEGKVWSEEHGHWHDAVPVKK